MSSRNRLPALALLASLTLLSGTALAAPASTVLYRSGGVTVDEFVEMNREAKDYSMKLVLAAKGSGAYLADVDVAVKALSGGDVVISTRTEGPLLLAALPPGRYEVTATFKDVRPGAPTTLKRIVTVPRKGLAQAVLYFDTGDQVGADSPAGYSIR